MSERSYDDYLRIEKEKSKKLDFLHSFLKTGKPKEEEIEIFSKLQEGAEILSLDLDKSFKDGKLNIEYENSMEFIENETKKVDKMKREIFQRISLNEGGVPMIFVTYNLSFLSKDLIQCVTNIFVFDKGNGTQIDDKDPNGNVFYYGDIVSFEGDVIEEINRIHDKNKHNVSISLIYLLKRIGGTSPIHILNQADIFKLMNNASNLNLKEKNKAA